MRRDLFVTAVLFLAVGFIGGYIFSQATGRSVTAFPVGEMLGASPSESAPAQAGLPEGHPPLDVAQSWRTLQEKAEKNPGDAQAALELANFLYDLDRWDDAVFWYRRAVELEPKNTDSRTDLATTYFHLQRFDDALAEYGRALELEPNKPQALYGLAMTRWQGKQDRAGAQQAYEQLRRSHPDFPGVELLARELSREGARR
ncbi:MAG: tetratricopeptide repeat protein [Candidatus Acidiferrales bacterium]